MISIILPFYNTEKYIEECLSSIKAQTFSDFECLMIDDGSTDNSTEIAKKYLDDSRFKLLGGKHIGFPLSKNLGLDNAKGEYICFIDSDDFVEPQYLELLYRGITESGSDMCCCGYRPCFDSIIPIFNNFQYQLSTHVEDKMKFIFFQTGSSFLWNKIYRRELFNNLRCENVISLSDTLMSPILYDRAKSIAIIETVLIYHRHHNGNMSYIMRSCTPEYWEHRFNVYLKICPFIINNYPYMEQLTKQIFKREWDTFVNNDKTDAIEKYIGREDVKLLLN